MRRDARAATDAKVDARAVRMDDPSADDPNDAKGQPAAVSLTVSGGSWMSWLSRESQLLPRGLNSRSAGKASGDMRPAEIVSQPIRVPSIAYQSNVGPGSTTR